MMQSWRVSAKQAPFSFYPCSPLSMLGANGICWKIGIARLGEPDLSELRCQPGEHSFVEQGNFPARPRRALSPHRLISFSE